MADRVGEELGRYRLEELIGRGGMGAVYRAYDPDLERDVAIKILRVDKRALERARDRLVREAQAMARISHPNVVPVFDVGVSGNEVFVAMEFVDGKTLREWAREEERSVDEILDVFLQAGRGLAAAHAAGLVHRDFKPGNVLIDDSGRARVTDFGLVRAYEPASTTTVPTQTPEEPAADVDVVSSLTQTAAVVGTPAYMAPEQHVNASVDHRADQYAFGVSLYEALYGVRPFGQTKVVELARAKRKGKFRLPPAVPRTSVRVRDVLLRTLTPNPLDRFATMDELMRGLKPATSRRRLAMLAVGGAGVVVAGAVFAPQIGDDRCDGAAQKLDGVWDDGRREATRAAFTATKRIYAEATFEGVAKRLDAYATEWVDAHRHACEAGVALDLRMACLEGRRGDLSAVADGLAKIDADALEHVFGQVDALAPVDGCADVDALRRANVPVPAGIAATVAELRGELERASKRALAGDAKGGLEVATPVLVASKELGYTPLEAEASYHAGRLALDVGEPHRAAQLLEDATLLAREAALDQIEGDAAVDLVSIYASDLPDVKKANRWASEARSVLARIGSPGRLKAELEDSLGFLAVTRGDLNAAREHHRAGLDLRIAVFGHNDDRVAISVTNLANVALRMDDATAATQGYARALAIRKANRGEKHPSIATLIHNIGVAHWTLGNTERAREQFLRALAMREEILGPQHPRVAATLAKLGALADEQGETDAAVELLQRAHEINARVYGVDHPDSANTANNLANALFRKGDLEGARDRYRTALTGFEARLGARHPDVAIALHNLGLVHEQLSDPAGAEDYYARAVAVRTDLLAPTHGKLAKSRVGLGRVLLELDRPDEAVPLLRSALATQQAKSNESTTARTEFLLARALMRTAPAEAERLAKAALERSEVDEEFRARVRAWIGALE